MKNKYINNRHYAFLGIYINSCENISYFLMLGYNIDHYFHNWFIIIKL